MKTYLVGGAVRDFLLGREVKDRDFVVVGSTPKEMKAWGFKRVGGSFPVFLHPDTGEEYALARTERKRGRGYTGFKVQFDPGVTLEDDLARRDLTINAMAFPHSRDVLLEYEGLDKLIDPHGGKADLHNGVLRHVSEAFKDDPLRVLRVARFAARYDFTVAPETMKLMRGMSRSGELGYLTPERVWQELLGAMGEDHPERFFDVLRGCDALHRVFPMVLEGDTINVDRVNTTIQRIAVLFAGSDLDEVKRFNPSKDYMQAIATYRSVRDTLTRNSLTPAVALDLFNRINLWKKSIYFSLAIHSLYGVFGVQTKHRLSFLIKAADKATKISYKDIPEEKKETLRGKEIGQYIDWLRVKAIRSM